MALYFQKITSPSAGEGRTHVSGNMRTSFLIGTLAETQQSMLNKRGKEIFFSIFVR